MKFKKGDKIRCLHTDQSHLNARHGEIVTVLNPNAIDTSGHNAIECRTNADKQWFIYGPKINKEWELVEENMTELEQLVKAANDGYQAVYRLQKEFGNSVEFSVGQFEESYYKEWILLRYAQSLYTPSKIRILQKPKFEPFYIMPNKYEVKLENDIIHIGCQKFYSDVCRNALQSLILENGSWFQINEYRLESTKTGIKYLSTIVPWSDAEKILDALTKAGY